MKPQHAGIKAKNTFKLKGLEKEYSTSGFVSSEESLSYAFEQSDKNSTPVFYDRKDMWRYFHLLPLCDATNIITLGEGATSLTRITELEEYLNGAQLFCKNEGENPTGTFKDREASYIISKAKEFGLKQVVFHSTGNTGRAYSVYASECTIESFFFLPLSCMDKCSQAMIKDNIHVIGVDGPFSKVGGAAKYFAKKNGFTAIAPLHDKLEGKATLAYEQYEELPQATMYVQTIAGGYGILGFLLGHTRLKEFGISPKDYKIPRIIAVQAGDGCTIAKAMEVGKEKLTDEDLMLPLVPFEKTLQSSNPLKTFSDVSECLKITDGLICSSSVAEVEEIRELFQNSLSEHNIRVSYENEKSPYISYAGLVKLAKKGLITSKDVIYMVITGRGCDDTRGIQPEAVIRPVDSGYEVVTTSGYLRGLF